MTDELEDDLLPAFCGIEKLDNYVSGSGMD